MLISFETPAHGSYQAPASLVDHLDERYRCRSVDQLRLLVETRAGVRFGDVHSRLALLVVLADVEAAEHAHVAARITQPATGTCRHCRQVIYQRPDGVWTLEQVENSRPWVCFGPDVERPVERGDHEPEPQRHVTRSAANAATVRALEGKRPAVRCATSAGSNGRPAGADGAGWRAVLDAALVIASSTPTRAWLHGNDPMALRQLDSAIRTCQDSQAAAPPVYLVIVDTDTGGLAYIVRFDSEADLHQWETRVDRLTGGAQQPFGFRAEQGLTDTILTPEQALGRVGERT